MPKKICKIRIFVASPSDVSEERDIVDRVCKDLNRGIGRHRDILIEVVKWETCVIPAAGRPQQIVFDSIGDDIDVFVAIFWKRFGTPTGVADSGSEEEVRQAFKKWNETGSPRLMFYFRTWALYREKMIYLSTKNFSPLKEKLKTVRSPGLMHLQRSF